MTDVLTSPQLDTVPANPLRRWLDKRGISVYAAAKTIQATGYPVTVERLRQASLDIDSPAFCRPTWPLMGAIYRLTGGAVTPNAWADPREFPGLNHSD